ncbi:haloacid dehalogenase type II [uncultured Agrococcus sp.]|uniref:haloacid dehalogenase type II n=1 Tax=uncultured Agrococcus sp. TaxID=382258 RepID=UPI0025F7EFA8|nr:haloacid dehalogenase type II [uncultured Agrococcus sp.]
MNLTGYEALSFDVYGTLIDWEAGIASVLVPWARARNLERNEEELLVIYAGHEARVLRENPTLLYPRATEEAFTALGDELGVLVTSRDREAMSSSVPHWPAFEDTAAALRDLAQHYKLIVLSNIDDASFSEANKKLGVDFDATLTAERIGSYKPEPANFDSLLNEIATQGIAQENLLHVAQSLFHDHVPAQRAGITSAWIDRRHDRPGWGATPPPPSDVEPSMRFISMREFADACERAFEQTR